MRYSILHGRLCCDRCLRRTPLSASWQMTLYSHLNCFFFFQAEDGIRYLIVTGVQTCALPISPARSSGARSGAAGNPVGAGFPAAPERAPEDRAGGDDHGGVRPLGAARGRDEIGRASCRERVEISVVAGSLKKKR